MKIIQLPDIETLRKLTQSLAILDAILSPEWESRYYSFNAQWGDKEAMASMRDGEGDHWFIHFTPQGALFKGFAHESAMAKNTPWPGVLDSVPPVFAQSLAEPAFMTDDTTFCTWRERGDVEWKQGAVDYPDESDPDGWNSLTELLDGDPIGYQQWAEEYYDLDLDLECIRAIYRFEPLTATLVESLNPEIELGDVVEDAAEIGYPVATDGV
jgi:hypothetical protein